MQTLSEHPFWHILYREVPFGSESIQLFYVNFICFPYAYYVLYAHAVIVEFMGVDAFISIFRPRDRGAESVKHSNHINIFLYAP